MTRDEQVAEYRALLRAEWDETTLIRSVALLRSFSAFQQVESRPLKFGLGDVLVGVDSASPELARDLVVGLVAAKQSHDPLLRDSVSLVASQALEELDTNGPEALANALLLVAKFMFDEAPARRHSLEAEIHAARGRPRAALAAWRAALATTETTSHDYLSRVQTLWFAFLDQEMTEDADVLISTLPRELREEFHREVEEGLSAAAGADDSDLLRIQAGLPFGDDHRDEEESTKNTSAPSSETETPPSGDACTS